VPTLTSLSRPLAAGAVALGLFVAGCGSGGADKSDYVKQVNQAIASLQKSLNDVGGAINTSTSDVGAQAGDDFAFVRGHLAEQFGQLPVLHLAGSFGVEIAAVACDLDQIVQAVLGLGVRVHSVLL
jgi:hypothetical protein